MGDHIHVGFKPSSLPSEGPELLRDDAGRPVLRYMYAHWVFTWPQDSARVTIEHGDLYGADNMAFPDDWAFNLATLAWTRLNLAKAAEDWYRNHLHKLGIYA